MSNTGYDPYNDYVNVDGGRGHQQYKSNKPWTKGGTAEQHGSRLHKIHDGEMLSAMQGYEHAGAVGAAQGAIARGQAAQEAAYQASGGGLAARSAMMGVGVRGAADASTAATAQMAAERQAAVEGAMNAQARGAEYELAVMQSRLAQQGIEWSHDQRMAAAQQAAREREAKQRAATARAAAAAAAGIAGSAGSWAAGQMDDGDDSSGYGDY